ncbi:ubiquitin-conjugating enzyme-like protein [Tritrichomonas musculus]|uniref:Ubiquitin-conjugating enzyme-like protein n=1 Tax=Tritrichomonas musculus TaxID=1915356 RepID=A0ABR2I5W4_9EUKA
MASKAARRLNVDLKKIQVKEAIEGVTVETAENDVFNWNVKIQGPSGTPYEGRILTVKMVFSDEYPHKEPSLAFNPPIYHPNVDPKTGVPCLSILQKWAPTLTITAVIKDLIEVITNPDPGHAVDADIGQEYANNRDEFNRKARSFNNS